jgi:hypothetical protein
LKTYHPLILGKIFNLWYFSVENKITTNVFWLSSGSIDLSLADQVRIQSREDWISDEIINAAQFLLRKQFPTIAGFRNSLQFSIVKGETSDLEKIYTSTDRIRDDSVVSKESFKRHLTQAGYRQIQILFVNGNHWITVSNQHSGPLEDVHVFDSLPPNYEDYVNHQIASVFRQSTAQINLIWPPMCKQPNSNDCGVYAIAAAVALAFGEKPEAQNLNNSVKYFEEEIANNASQFSAISIFFDFSEEIFRLSK